MLERKITKCELLKIIDSDHPFYEVLMATEADDDAVVTMTLTKKDGFLKVNLEVDNGE